MMVLYLSPKPEARIQTPQIYTIILKKHTCEVILFLYMICSQDNGVLVASSRIKLTQKNLTEIGLLT